MSGPPRVRSMNQAESEGRPVLGPAGNKSRSAVELRKPVTKPKINNKADKVEEFDDDVAKGKKSPASEALRSDSSPSPSPPVKKSATSILRKQEARSVLMRSNLSMNASCSSDASSDSSNSRASTGRISRRSGTTVPSPMPMRRKQHCCPKIEKIEKNAGDGETLGDDFLAKKRCAWVTANTDPSYAAFHDEEWGVPVHDDRKLFELLSFCVALAELTWPTILNKRCQFREVFQDFDPVAVSKLSEKKISTPGSPASSLLSELKLRAIIENARQTCKIINEFGSFDKYIWGFVNYKPSVGHFRYPRQVPIKTSKADAISKDLVKRGFRGVGPTVVYSFLQVAGINNDHLISCFRFHDCLAAADNTRDKDDNPSTKIEGKQVDDAIGLALAEAIDDLSLCT